jgi:hypothetical protein
MCLLIQCGGCTCISRRCGVEDTGPGKVFEHEW